MAIVSNNSRLFSQYISIIHNEKTKKCKTTSTYWRYKMSYIHSMH